MKARPSIDVIDESEIKGRLDADENEVCKLRRCVDNDFPEYASDDNLSLALRTENVGVSHEIFNGRLVRVFHRLSQVELELAERARAQVALDAELEVQNILSSSTFESEASREIGEVQEAGGNNIREIRNELLVSSATTRNQ